MVAMEEQAPKRRPQDTDSTAASTDVGRDMGMGWLRAIGLCPYVVVSPEGACRLGWLPAAWCVVHLAVGVALQVWMNVMEEVNREIMGLYRPSIVATVGAILLVKGSRVVFSGTCLVLLLLSPRLARLVKEVAALRKLAGSLNPTGPQRLGVVSLVYKWVCLVVYMYFFFKNLGFMISNWGGTWWLVWVVWFGEWLLSFAILPAVVLLFSAEMCRLQAATRAVLPPRWELLVTEVRDKVTGIHCGTPWCVSTSAAPSSAIPSLAPFLRRARVLLLQTEEVLACLLAYLGWPLLVCLSYGTIFFTFSTYFLVVELRTTGEFDYASFLLVLLLVLALLTINMEAENVVQERRRCARVYRRLLAHPDVAQLPEAAEVLEELERPVQMRIMQLFNLGGSCVTTIFSLALSYLVIALQVAGTEE